MSNPMLQNKSSKWFSSSNNFWFTDVDLRTQVLDLIRPKHRLVVFLQQSSVEWASSLWLPVIQEVDPEMSRSVVVVSKMDNRMREFDERWELDKWLAADALPKGKGCVRPFYIALPKDRHFESNAHFRYSLSVVI